MDIGIKYDTHFQREWTSGQLEHPVSLFNGFSRQWFWVGQVRGGSCQFYFQLCPTPYTLRLKDKECWQLEASLAVPPRSLRDGPSAFLASGVQTSKRLGNFFCIISDLPILS
jgi:hypothetical protein